VSGAAPTQVAVVLHGRSCDAGFFRAALCPPPSGWTVVLVEYPGFGVWTDEYASEQRCVEAARNSIRAVVRHYGAQNTTVLGHSLGAAIALLAVDALPPEGQPSTVVLAAAFPSIRGLAQHSLGVGAFLVHEAFPAGMAAARLGATAQHRIAFAVHHTRDDLLVDRTQGALIARALHVPLQVQPGGHSQYAFFSMLWPDMLPATVPGMVGQRWI
jgi:pimeloyl-ACP methyl ester carboxylesterase